MTDESKKVTTISHLASESRQCFQEIGDLGIDISRIGDGRCDLLAKNLTVTAPKPVSSNFHSPFAHSQRFADLFIGLLDVIPLQLGSQMVE